MFLYRQSDRVTPQVKRALKAIGENSEYEIFKVFVGHDVGFYPNLDFEKAQNYRNQKIQEYAKDIDATNIAKWKRTFKRVTKNYREVSDPGLFQYFSKFLFELGKQKPDLALQLISEKALEPFLIHIVGGVWKSKKKTSAKKLVSKWVSQSKYLATCSAIFDYVEEMDQKLFKLVVDKAIHKKDTQALNALVSSIGRNYNNQPFLRTAFIKIIKTLTTMNDTFWVHGIWFRKNAITKDLTRVQYKAVLENLFWADRLDWNVEEVLEPLVSKYPVDFVEFLLSRVEHSKKFKRKLAVHYDAVPHRFHKLGDTLRKKSKVIIPAVLKWFSMGDPKKDRWLYRWEAAHFLKDVFPGSDPLLQKELLKMIKKGGKEGETVIHSFISRFEGEEFLWTLVEEIVNAYTKAASYTEIKGSLFGYLSQTGVVSGEYGFVEAYTQKRKAIQSLKTSSNTEFCKFLEEYDDYLKKRIASEKKRADDDIYRRKRDYGVE